MWLIEELEIATYQDYITVRLLQYGELCIRVGVFYGSKSDELRYLHASHARGAKWLKTKKRNLDSTRRASFLSDARKH